jgi:hypothetical protein
VKAKPFDFQTVEYTIDLPASTRQKYVSQGLFHLGKNQKQNRVRMAGQ